MYICLEGIKGSGKSSLFNALCLKLVEKNIDFSTITPTKASNNFSILEWLNKKIFFLQKIDYWNELIYSVRSNQAAKKTDWSKKIILGDRSVVTSYATRWTKWGNPEICIERINKKHISIKAPDVVIYLNISLETALTRIKTRENRKYGKQDETPIRLDTVQKAYQAIKEHSIKRLSNTRWYFVDAEQTPEKLLFDCMLIIEQIISSNK